MAGYSGPLRRVTCPAETLSPGPGAGPVGTVSCFVHYASVLSHPAYPPSLRACSMFE